MATEYIIDYKNISSFYNKNKVLENIDFQLSEGEFVFLIGEVGSGKTSFLKTIYADLPIKQGEAQVVGIKLRKIKSKNIPILRRQIGIVFQDFNLLTDRTVSDNLKFVLEATGWTDLSEIEARIESVLREVKIADKINSMPHELSGGERQRVVIARAILNNPKLIIADEPTANLDHKSAQEITNLLFEFSQQGSSVIFATHNRDLLNSPNSRIIKIEKGILV